MIDEEIFGRCRVMSEQDECNQIFARMNIFQYDENPSKTQRNALFDDPTDSILSREKGAPELSAKPQYLHIPSKIKTVVI